METSWSDIQHAWRMFRESKLLTATAFAAVWIAARRASRIDPLEALRYE